MGQSQKRRAQVPGPLGQRGSACRENDKEEDGGRIGDEEDIPHARGATMARVTMCGVCFVEEGVGWGVDGWGGF